MSPWTVRIWMIITVVIGLDSAVISQTMPQAGAVSAPPDTHLVWLQGLDGSPSPKLNVVLADTVWFGAPLSVETGSVDPSLAVDLEDAYAVVDGIERHGENLTIVLRLFWTGPVRLGWAGDPASLTEVFEVRGRVADLETAAPVRAPWSPNRNVWLLVGVVLLLLLVMAAGLAWADHWRRHRRILGEDSVSSPAWIDFVRGADLITEDGFASPERVSDDLGRLAAVLRAYVKRRLLVKISGLPTSEIVEAFSDHAYPVRTGAAIADVLERIDQVRFRRTGASASEAREIFAEAFTAVEGTVGERTRTAVGGRDSTEAEMIWRRLRERSEAWSGVWHQEVSDAL